MNANQVKPKNNKLRSKVISKNSIWKKEEENYNKNATIKAFKNKQRNKRKSTTEKESQTRTESKGSFEDQEMRNSKCQKCCRHISAKRKNFQQLGHTEKSMLYHHQMEQDNG